jgi:hypothetical protein
MLRRKPRLVTNLQVRAANNLQPQFPERIATYP